MVHVNFLQLALTGAVVSVMVWAGVMPFEPPHCMLAGTTETLPVSCKESMQKDCKLLHSSVKVCLIEIIHITVVSHCRIGYQSCLKYCLF